MRLMPELPVEIWEDRLNNEFNTLKNLNVVQTDSIIWHENNVELLIKIKAIGFVLGLDQNPENLMPKTHHKIFFKINRTFPYPGGIDFAWQSSIFHPNIHPVKITSTREPGTGYICLNVLKQWSRLSDLENTVKALQKLVENPNPDDPLKYDICMKAAEYFKEHTMENLKDRFNLEDKDEDEGDDDDIIVIDD